MGAKTSKPLNQNVQNSQMPIPLSVLSRQSILNMKRDELKTKYMRARDNTRTAPPALHKAEKEYLVFDKGETYYTEQQEEKYTNQANQ